MNINQMVEALNSPPLKKAEPKYLFYIETQKKYLEWRGLTKKQARDMYAYTEAHQPSEVTTYGWEEIKPAIQGDVK